MITLSVPIPLKNCRQCSHYRGGYCYGFGTAKQVFSESEAILCGVFTPLGQVQIGPLDSLAGQLKEYQIPAGIISTLKLADLAVTIDKLGLSSVIDSKVAAAAGIVESKLNLDFSTSDLDADIQTRLLAATYLAHDHSLADPTQVDFNNLLNKYTDADAVAAVEAESTLVLPGTLQVATKIGIGKAPSYAVDIQGMNAVDVTLNAERYNDAAYGIAWYMKKARGTVAVPVIVNDNDFLYELIGYGHDGTAFIAAAKIEFKINGTPGTNDMPGKILFLTTPDGGIIPVLAMTIDSQQNITLMGNLTVSGGTIDAPIVHLESGAGQSMLFDCGNQFNWRDKDNADAIVATLISSTGGLRLGVPTQTTDPIELLRFSTERAWSFRKRSSGGGTKLALEADTASKEFWIGYDNGIVYAAKFFVSDIQGNCTVQLGHNVTVDNNLIVGGTVDGVDVSAQKTEVDGHLVLGAGNATWINCPLESWNVLAAFRIGGFSRVYNEGATNGEIYYSVPLPTNRGGKKLYISGTRVSIAQADANNFVSTTEIIGQTDIAATNLDSDPTDKNTVLLHEDVSMGAIDCSGQHTVKTKLECIVATGAQLAIQFMTVRYYYA